MIIIQREEIEFNGVTGFEDLYDSQVFKIIPIKNPDEIVLLRVLWEIARNIRDHNYGWGYLKIERSIGGLIKFEAGNSKIPELAKKILYERDRTKGGSGLGSEEKKGMIFGLAEFLGVKLEVDIAAGYVYRGVYKKINDSED